ncbi:MAG: protein kinase, partial [Mycobacteriales bacterium]|nr:protein kinase [Mycobacteriales bacterium]
MTRVLGDRYDVGEPLRRTGFGQVRVGTRRADDAPVAVELLDEALATDPAVRTRCDTGEAVLCAVSGRHLVRVQALVVEADGIGVVRDRVGGSDLCALRAEAGGTLAPREAVSLVVDVLDALSDLHAAGLVHGALRERDVLVDLDVPLRPVTRLTGYGTAALVRGRAVPTEDVLAAGRLLCVLLSGVETLPDGLPRPLQQAIEPLLLDDPCGRPTAAQARDALADLPGLRGLAPLPPADAPTGLAALLAAEG